MTGILSHSVSDILYDGGKSKEYVHPCYSKEAYIRAHEHSVSVPANYVKLISYIRLIYRRLRELLQYLL